MPKPNITPNTLLQSNVAMDSLAFIIVFSSIHTSIDSQFPIAMLDSQKITMDPKFPEISLPSSNPRDPQQPFFHQSLPRF